MSVGVLLWSAMIAVSGVAGASRPSTAATEPIVRMATSVEARQALDRAETLADQGLYVQAGREYLRLLAEHGQKVVREADGSYRGLGAAVREQVAGWPAEAREVCREVFEPQAAAALAGAGGETASAAEMMGFAQRWWLSRSAGEAGLGCARRLAADECNGTAGWVLGQLAGTHPESADAIRAAIAKIETKAGEAVGVQTRPGSLPAGEVLWRLDLGGEAFGREADSEDREAASGRQGPAGALEREPANGVVLESSTGHPGPAGVLPVLSRPTICGDVVVVQGAGRVWGIGLYGGEVGWVVGQAAAAAAGAADVRTPAVVLGNVAAVAVGHDGDRLGWGLVCIDPGGGEVRWSRSAEVLTGVTGESADWVSGPVGYERAVYVLVGSWTGTLEDVYLVRVEAGSGEVSWRRHLAGWIGGVSAAGEVAAKDGVVSVRIGGVAARVAALTGEIERLTVKNLEPPKKGNGPGKVDWRSGPGGEVVVVTEGTEVRAEVRGGKAEEVLAARIDERPTDCGRYVDLARWAAGEPTGGERMVAAMEQALACDAKSGTAGTAASVQRAVFELAMEHAGRADVTERLEAMASRAAGGEEEQAKWRLRFGAVRLESGQAVRAVALWQEVLDSERLRGCVVGGETAGEAAERLTAEAIGREGRGIYEAVEAQAGERLDEADGRADGLLAVVRRYPNSRAAVRAMSLLAEVSRQRGCPGEAIQWLQQAMERCEASEWPGLIAQIAAVAMEAGDGLRGLAWLARGVREYPEAEVAFAGRTAKFGELYQTWLANARTIERPAPEVEPPLGLGFERRFDGAVALLRPVERESGPVVGRYDLVVVYNGSELQALEPAGGRVRWRKAWPGRRAPVWLADDEWRVVLATPYRLAVLERTTGKYKWVWEVNPTIEDEALIDPEVLEAVTAWAVNDAIVVGVSRSGEGRAMRLADGREAWRVRIGSGVGVMAADDERVVCVRMGEGGSEAVVLDAESGVECGRFGLAGGGRPHTVAMTPEGVVVIADGGQVAAYVCGRAELVWRWTAADGGIIAGLRMGVGQVYAYGPGFVAAVSWTDGRPRWEKDPFDGGPEVIRGVWVGGGQVYVVGESSVAALVADTGERRWVERAAEGETVESAELMPRWLGMIVSRAAGGSLAGPREVDVVFYPRAAGVAGDRPAVIRCPLGKVEAGVRGYFLDRAVLIQSGGRLVGWTSTGPADVR